MNYKAGNRIIILMSILMLSSCATMVRGTTQDISVNTTPSGAHVQFSNGVSCMSPCNIVVERKSPLQVTITKAGYHTHTCTFVPTLSGSGVILGGGGLIDFGTGAVYDLQPQPYHATLIPITGMPH